MSQFDFARGLKQKKGKMYFSIFRFLFFIFYFFKRTTNENSQRKFCRGKKNLRIYKFPMVKEKVYRGLKNVISFSKDLFSNQRESVSPRRNMCLFFY